MPKGVYDRQWMRGEGNPNFGGKAVTLAGRQRISEFAKTRIGNKNPNFGKGDKISGERNWMFGKIGENNPNWRGGLKIAHKRTIAKIYGNVRIRNRIAREKKYGVRCPTWWLCDICSKPISLFKSEICLDHDHTTGKFRAWLCHGCNPKVEWVEKFGMRIQMVIERNGDV